MTNKTQIAETLSTAIYELSEGMHELHEDGVATAILDVSSFADNGLMTIDEGIVIEMKDGSVFQVTVVQSRNAQ